MLQSHSVLHRALKQARHWGLTNTLPTDLVAVPRAGQREMRALSAAQLATLFTTSRSSHWYSLWVVLGTAGLRIGEALGLKWTDVDLVAGRLQVRRGLQRQRGRGLVFVEPKSYRSRRMGCLCQLAVEALTELREHMTVSGGTVQDLLGHSTVALTLNTYSHVTAGLSDQAAKTMDQILVQSVPWADFG